MLGAPVVVIDPVQALDQRPTFPLASSVAYHISASIGRDLVPVAMVVMV